MSFHFLFLVELPLNLLASYSAKCSDDIIIDFAKHTLGMQRCRENTIRALRVILGNQAVAQQLGSHLRLSRTAGFASEQALRTLIDRFVAAGLARMEMAAEVWPKSLQ